MMSSAARDYRAFGFGDASFRSQSVIAARAMSPLPS
jgi:hypothetical protein